MKTDSVIARWQWAAHARRCAACAEVRTAERFVEAFAAGAGRWPAAGEAVRVRGTRRAWKLAGALVVIALLLPLAGSAVWRMRQGRFHNPVATADRRWEATATTPEGRAIQSVRFVIRGRVAMWDMEQTEDAWDSTPWDEAEVSIQYPDKMRIEPVAPATGTIAIRSGDRELSDLGEPGGEAAGLTPEHYRYMIARPVVPIVSPDAFTEAGATEAGRVDIWSMSWYPKPVEWEEDVFQSRVDRGPNGEQVLVVEHRKVDDPSFHGVYRTSIDPLSHRVLGWDYRTEFVARRTGERVQQEQVVEQVEYNVDLPGLLFHTDPPEGADVLDAWTPEGLKRWYDWQIRGLEESRAEEPAEAWAESVWVQNSAPAEFGRLDVLYPGDREEIRAKLATLGIERDGRPVAAAAQPKRDQAQYEQALADLERDSAELERRLREMQPKQGPGLAPPLTKEQTDEARHAQAAAQKFTEVVQARAKALAAEQEALQARVQQITAESEAHRAALQRAQKDLAAAQAAAKQDGEKARAQLKEAQAQAAEVARQVSTLLAERARLEAKQAQLEKEAGAAAARVAEAQRALEAARAPKAAGKPAKKK